jgi:hypothetical protein
MKSKNYFSVLAFTRLKNELIKFVYSTSFSSAHFTNMAKIAMQEFLDLIEGRNSINLLMHFFFSFSFEEYCWIIL